MPQNNRHYKRKLTLPSIIIGVIIIIIAILLQLSEINNGKKNSDNKDKENKLIVHFVDVGQGDCTIIQTANTNIIIDAGEITAKTAVLSYIEKLGIDKFDYVIASHPHSDHIGSLDDVIDNYKIGSLIMPKVPDFLVPTNTIYEEFLDSISNKGLKIKQAKPDATLEFDGATLQILSPINDYENLNNYSIVCKITYGEKSFLVTGDAEKDPELDMIERYGDKLKVDVLRVGHHGSYTSTNKEFLSLTNPEYAVISVGAGNDYEHPHVTLMKRLKGYNILRTDLDGSITFITDGKTLEYTTTK